eukprot:12049851-Karenia_brevis.AAC.1
MGLAVAMGQHWLRGQWLLVAQNWMMMEVVVVSAWVGCAQRPTHDHHHPCPLMPCLQCWQSGLAVVTAVTGGLAWPGPGEARHAPLEFVDLHYSYWP